MDVEDYIRNSKYSLEEIKSLMEILILKNMRKFKQEYIKPEEVSLIKDKSYSNDLYALSLSAPWKEFMDYIEYIFNKVNESR